MVATREQRAQKLARNSTLPPMRSAPILRMRSRATMTPILTTVNNHEVSTLDDETVAFALVGSAQIEFRVPAGIRGAAMHTLCVAYLRRRGPDYAPARERIIVTLDERGRQRDTVEY